MYYLNVLKSLNVIVRQVQALFFITFEYLTCLSIKRAAGIVTLIYSVHLQTQDLFCNSFALPLKVCPVSKSSLKVWHKWAGEGHKLVVVTVFFLQTSDTSCSFSSQGPFVRPDRLSVSAREQLQKSTSFTFSWLRIPPTKHLYELLKALDFGIVAIGAFHTDLLHCLKQSDSKYML